MTQTAFFAPATGVDVMLQKAAGGSPPADPIGNPFFVGGAEGAAAGGTFIFDIPVANAVAAGTLIQPGIQTRNTATAVSCTDSKGNSYAVAPYKVNGQAGRTWLALGLNIANALTTSDYIRWTLNEATGCTAWADAIPDAHLTAPLDIDVDMPAVISTAAGGFNYSSGAFASSADEIVMEIMPFYDVPGTVTPTTGFTALTSVGSSSQYVVRRHWKRQQSTAALTFNASWLAGASTQHVGHHGRAFKGK